MNEPIFKIGDLVMARSYFGPLDTKKLCIITSLPRLSLDSSFVAWIYEVYEVDKRIFNKYFESRIELF